MKVFRIVADVVMVVAGVITGNPALILAGGADLIGTLTAPPPPEAPGSQTSWQADPMAGIPYPMGRLGYAGKVVYRQSWSQHNAYQMLVTVYGAGPIDGFETLFFDGKPCTEGGPPHYKTGLAGGDVFEIHQVGNSPSSYLHNNPNTTGSDTSDNAEWTSAHKLSGLAASHLVAHWDVKGDNTLTQIPQMLRVMRGVKCYDPRLDDTYPGGSGDHRWAPPTDVAGHDAAKATWEFSEDPYIHGLNWLLGRWERDTTDGDSIYRKVVGVGAPTGQILVDQFVEGANVCEANEWTISGVPTSVDDKWDVLKRILVAGGGVPVRQNAKIGCIVSTAKVSIFTVTEADIVGDCELQATQAKRDRVNCIIPRVTFEDLVWEEDAASPVIVDDYVTFDGAQRNKESTYDYVAIPAGEDPTQAVQLARYEIENAREIGPATLPLKLRFMGYRPGDCGTVTNGEIGLSARKMMITSRSLNPATGVVTMTCRTETDGKHPFALGQTGTAPATPTVNGPPPPPDANDDTWAITASVISANGTSIPALIIEGAVGDDAPADLVLFEFREYDAMAGDDDNWQSSGAPEAPSVTVKVITGLKDLTDYEVSIRYRMGIGYGPRLILGPATTDSSIIPIPTMPKPADVTIEQDYTGTTALSGQYPAHVQFSRSLGGYDVTATTSFSIVSTTGSLVATGGTPNITINDSFGDPDRGLLEATDGLGKVTVKTERTGEQDLYQTIEVKGHPASPPATNVDTAPGDVTSTSDNITSDVLHVLATDTSIALSANLTFRCGSPGANLNSNVKGKFIRSTSPSMTSPSDVGSFVTGNAEVAPAGGGGKGGGEIPGADGSLIVSISDTGRTIGVDYYYEFVEQAIATPDTYPIHQFGTIRADA